MTMPFDDASQPSRIVLRGASIGVAAMFFDQGSRLVLVSALTAETAPSKCEKVLGATGALRFQACRTGSPAASGSSRATGAANRVLGRKRGRDARRVPEEAAVSDVDDADAGGRSRRSNNDRRAQ